MAEGLNADDLAAIQSFSRHPEWARGPMAEIYSRHGIKSDVDPVAAAEQIEKAASAARAGQSAWVNPEERAAAREAYARQGKTSAEVKQRWADSIYLMDPRTQEYMQKYGRDADFLQSSAKWKPHEPPKFYAGMSPSGPANIAAHIENQSLDFYNRSKDGTPLYRTGVANANYERFGGLGGSVMDATSNPDLASGEYMQASEVLPNHLRMQGSGESKSENESWRAARAQQLAAGRYRMSSPAPILDLPAGATPQQIANRIREMQLELQSASVPMAEERWQRTTGWTPPGYLADAGDFGISMIDPTILIPATKGAGALTKAANVAAKGARLSGSGWIAPMVRKIAAPVVKDAANDMMVEQGVGAGLMGAIGGNPGRSNAQFWQGGGKPGVDFAYKSGGYTKGVGPLSDVEIARWKRDQIYDRLKDDDGVSRADTEAYNRMRTDGITEEEDYTPLLRGLSGFAS